MINAIFSLEIIIAWFETDSSEGRKFGSVMRPHAATWGAEAVCHQMHAGNEEKVTQVITGALISGMDWDD